MGIFRDLVSNYATSKMQEEQHKLAYNLSLGDILTTLIQNPSTDDATYAKASAFYQDLMGKHGGKQGKDLQNQIGQFLTAYGTQRRQQRAQQQLMDTGGTRAQQGGPEDASKAGPGPGGLPADQPVPAGQTAGQPGGVNYGWDTTAKPSTLSGAGGPGAQDGRQPAQAEAHRGGFRGVLSKLAGVGGEMMGVPQDKYAAMTPTPAQIQRLYGPTGMETAEEKERELERASDMDRVQYHKRIDEDVAKKRMTPEQGEKAKADYDLYGKAPGSRAERNLPLSEQAFELEKASMAKGLGKDVSELTTDEQLQAMQKSVEKTRVMPENKIEDRDALNAYAEQLAAKDPARAQALGRPMTGEDLKPQERLDARMAWAKQKALRGEEMPTEAKLREMVNYDLLTGHTTAMGMSASDPFRRAYINMRSTIIAERGAREVATQVASFKSDQLALNNLQRINDAMSGWESATKKNLEQVRILSKQVGRYGSTLANDYQQFLQGKMETYPELTKFKIAVETGVAEYTRVMYSATPSGVTTDEQKRTGRDMLSIGMSEGNVDAAIDQMYTDMGNRKSSMDEQVWYIQARMRGMPTGPGGAGSGANIPTPTEEERKKLPTGTLYRDPDGNIRRKK